MRGAVGRTVRRSLWDQVPRDHRETTRALRRRQAVTLTFLVIGALVLSFSLRIDPGNDWFYPATLGLALVWTIGLPSTRKLRTSGSGGETERAGPAAVCACNGSGAAAAAAPASAAPFSTWRRVIAGVCALRLDTITP